MDTAAKTAHLTTFQPKGHLKDQAFDAELYARVGGVPEHSVSLMARASNGRAFREGNYLFLADRDWLLGIGSCYIGTAMHSGSEIAEMYNIPQRAYPMLVLALGYPADIPAKRRKLGP